MTSMAEETRLTFIGNLTRDPETRFLENGDAVCRFAIASTPRYLDRKTNEWKDGDPFFLECTAWRALAENVNDSFKKGNRVIATGVLKQRSYETDAGDKRTVIELTVEEIGASVRYATVEITKKKSGGGGGHAQRAAEGDDAWAGAAKARPADNGTRQGAQSARQTATSAPAGGGAFDDL
jgi:single-strand DNA-binding protein